MDNVIEIVCSPFWAASASAAFAAVFITKITTSGITMADITIAEQTRTIINIIALLKGFILIY